MADGSSFEPDDMVLIDGADDDDDDMADLFSFGAAEDGAGSSTVPASSPSHRGVGITGAAVPSSSTGMIDPTLSSSLPPSQQQIPTRTERASSDDSFLELLESEASSLSLASSMAGGAPHSPTPNISGVVGGVDDETRDILSWLEAEGQGVDPTTLKLTTTHSDAPPASPTATASSTPAASSPARPAPPPTPSSPSSQQPPVVVVPTPVTVTPTVVALPPLFTSLSQALASTESTTPQILQLALHHPHQLTTLTKLERAELYCRMLCGNKTFGQVQQSSLADSFAQYRQGGGDKVWPFPGCDDLAQRIWEYQQPQPSSSEPSSDHDNNNNTTPSSRSVEVLAEDLQTLLAYYFHHQSIDDDVLVPPVAATVLAACGSDVIVASVLLHQLVAQKLPLLALQGPERWDAALLLHHEWYLLACYHVPLLVFHLDRYVPGWYWPKAPPTPEEVLGLDAGTSSSSSSSPTNASATVAAAKSHWQLQNQRGCIPLSWMLSHLAGECGSSSSSNSDTVASGSTTTTAAVGLSLNALLTLWDQSLLVHDHPSAIRFFLVLAVLEHSADDLLLLTGDALKQRLHDVWQLKIVPDLWWNRAQQLQDWTPESVWIKLITAEDRAVQQSLQKRNERTQHELQLKLEAEATAHRIAQEEKAAAARERLTRARLVAFYRKHAPDKEANIDKIMQTYTGEWEVLDAKLKLKYGEGFNPPIKKQPGAPPPPPPSSSPFLSKNNNKLISTMNTGLGVRRNSNDLANPDGDRGDDDDNEDNHHSPSEQVSVLVAASEVLPVICWTKQAAAARGQERRRRLTDKKQLKFFLVDSRPEDAALEQGRFPTAVSLSPEAMLDPERLKENEDMFEALRGAVHIVVMGEGFAALPHLYGHKLTPKLEELMHEDESRTNICALFFVKKGFPFVSILNGGFAAAHSWLIRNGSQHHLNPSSVLVDYDPEGSMFGQLESLHNATATEKAQRKMQMLLDKSILAMTRRAQQLERMAAERDQGKDNRQVVRNLFGRSEASTESEEPSNEKRSFSIPFAGVVRSFSSDEGNQNDRAADASDTSRPVTAGSSPNSPEKTSERPVGADADASNEGGRAEDQTLPTSDAAGQNRFSMFRGVTKPESAPTATSQPTATASTTTAQQASNMFKGLGAAINQSIKATDGGAAGVLKRNPFARFGSGGGAIGGATSNTAPAGSSVPVAGAAVSITSDAGGSASSGTSVGGGWNQLRRAAMARMRVQDSGEEESISFSVSTTTPESSSELSIETKEGNAAATNAQVQKV